MTIDITPEAVERLAASLDRFVNSFSSSVITCEESKTLRALSHAITASQAETAAAYKALKVKPLVWEEPCKANNYTHIAQSIFGDYYVDVDGGRHLAWLESHAKPHENMIGAVVGRMYEAKAAAQADYDARILTAIELPADSKAALDRMIAEAEERGSNIGVATEKLGRLVEWLKEDEYNVFLLPADDVEKMRAILAAIPKGKDHE